MKIGVLTDTHLGVRNDAEVFLNHQLDYLKNIFIPKLVEEGVSVLIHMGDVFDQRKKINVHTLDRAKEEFFEELDRAGIEWFWILGNHDVYYKNTNSVNSSKAVSEFENITVVESEPLEIMLDCDGLRAILVPWINKENHSACFDALDQTKATIVFGHFEINGFEMTRGKKMDHGISQNLFSKFDEVYSGHFHLPGEEGNIRYLGAPYQMDWNDYGGERGGFIYDTETHNMTRIDNPKQMFNIFEYDDRDMSIEQINSASTEDVDDELRHMEGTFVKVLVKHRENNELYDYFRERMDEIAHDVKYVENPKVLKLEDTEETIEAEGTLEIIQKYVGNFDTPGLDDLMVDLYKEAEAL